ncbi:unnamed protein product [Candida verbasci]|uniref:DUF4484 domain-containing protein n=1 Tax=Candida verbasci TaxID=1227364 RepID=A0A9W4TVE8_9ASCO|nr:unnamed protein product [Candida verbasci]
MSPPNIIAIFLAEFDIKAGYKLIWSKTKTKTNINLDGLEYKVFPSGVHDFNNSTTLISHFDEKLYLGLSVFYQHTFGDSNDRSNVKMFSLGILTDGENGFEYVNSLNSKLVQFVNNQEKNYSTFEEIFKLSAADSIINHPLTKLPKMIKDLGPLLLTIYKQSLLRKKIILFNKGDTFDAGSFTYLISLLSTIPDQPTAQPIYQIGLNDLGGKLLEIDGYIAVTNDEIIKENRVYDIGVDLEEPRVFSRDGQIYATHSDFERFKKIYQPEIEVSNLETASKDDISITPTEIETTYLQIPDWYNTLVESNSWMNSIWSAFSWFATAGQLSQEQHLQKSTSIEFKDLVNIVGYFHSLTKKWIYIINELILDKQQESDELLVNLELTYQDLVEMELEYSDYEFIKEFILLYFESVSSVEIEESIFSICC